MSDDSVDRWDALDHVLDAGLRLHARFTTRGAGDFGFGVPSADLARRRAAVVDRPWAWMRQVHGATVVDLDADPRGLDHVNGSEADAMTTRSTEVAVSVTVADCAPVILFSDNGVLAAAHAGWQGAYLGVVEATVSAMRRLGADRVRAVIGPCIAPADYEFGADDLDRVAGRLGPGVRSSTRSGAPALDLRAAVRSALERSDAEVLAVVGGDTAGEVDRYFSHRARRDPQRQAAVAWLEAT